jgi:hypothetical protein
MSSMYMYPTNNPQQVSVDIADDSDGLIQKDSKAYINLGIKYVQNSDQDLPSSTTIQFTPTGKVGVAKVKTNTVGGHKLEDPVAWTCDNDVWSYEIPKEFIQAKDKHTVDFTVNWSNGHRHDPQIIINPTNP